MPSRSSSSRKRKPSPWLAGLRWTAGAIAMLATWYYAVWKGGYVMWIGLPAGVVVMVCTAAALTVPVVTTALVAVAFIAGIDSSLANGLRNAALAVVAVGMAMGTWRFVTSLRDRDRRR